MSIKDQIRAEIERRHKYQSEQYNKKESDGRPNYGWSESLAIMGELEDLLYFLDTLPEQPVEGLEVTDFCKPIDPGIAQCVADHWWELLDDENAADKKAVKEIVKTVHKEVTRQVKEMVGKQPVDGLEEAAKAYVAYLVLSGKDIEGVTIRPLRNVAENAFIAGAEWQKAKMMEEAVERVVKEDAGDYPYIVATELYDYENDKPLAKAGDKVRVIVIKEDEK